MKVTEPAQAHLNDLLKDGELLEIGLVGGGCGGATVTFTKVSTMSSGASNISGTTNVIFADSDTSTHLTGGSLDIDSSIFNARFIFKPPSGTDSCGCGSSIKIG